MTVGVASWASQMVDLLDDQVRQLERLAALGEALQQALVRADVASIEQALVEGQRVADRGRDLEERRYRLQGELARSWGMAPETLTWRELANRQPSLAPRLGQLRRRLLAAAQRLTRLHRENAALARQGLAWTRFGLEALAVAGDAPVYGRDGRRPMRPGRRAVDRVS